MDRPKMNRKVKPRRSSIELKSTNKVKKKVTSATKVNRDNEPKKFTLKLKPSHSNKPLASLSNKGGRKSEQLIQAPGPKESSTTSPAHAAMEPKPECSRCYNCKHEPESEELDTSIIREPINLGLKNVKQILECVHNGSAEAKDIILNECSIIYECKICRNLFRSLANLLAHKRIYCTQHSCSTMLLFNECSYNAMMEAKGDQPPTESTLPTSSYESEKSEIQQELKDKSRYSGCESHENIIFENVNMDQEKDRKRKHLENCLSKVKFQKKEHTSLNLMLVPIRENKNAVYQKVVHEKEIKESCNTMKDAKCSVTTDPPEQNSKVKISATNTTPPTTSKDDRENKHHNGINTKSISKQGSSVKIRRVSATNNKTCPAAGTSLIIHEKPIKESSNHRRITKSSQEENSVSSKSPEVQTEVRCTMSKCKSTFCSKKTLKVHLSTIHADRRMIYPCPFCCLTFKQLFNATRHMVQVHKKNKTQVKVLREVVRQRAYPESGEALDGSCADENEEDDEDDNSEEEFGDEEEQSQSSNSCNAVEKEDDREDAKLVLQRCTLGCGMCFTQSQEKLQHEKDANCCEPDTKTQNKAEKLLISKEKVQEKNGEQNSGALHWTRRLDKNPVIYSCVYNCGKCFIKTSSKITHEIVCVNREDSKSDSDSSGIDKDAKSSNTNRKNMTNGNNGHIDSLYINDHLSAEIEKIVNNKTLRCNRCPDLSYTTRNHLIQHAVVHLGYEVFKCKGCAFRTLERQEMDTHLGDVHGISKHLRPMHMVNLSTPLNREPFDRADEPVDESSLSSTRTKDASPTGIVLHIRPMQSANRSKKKLYQIV